MSLSSAAPAGGPCRLPLPSAFPYSEVTYRRTARKRRLPADTEYATPAVPTAGCRCRLPLPAAPAVCRYRLPVLASCVVFFLLQ